MLILDDFGLTALGPQERHDLLEVIEDRHGESSLVISGQLPVKAWHKYIGDPAVADAALDRPPQRPPDHIERRIDEEDPIHLDRGGAVGELKRTSVATLRPGRCSASFGPGDRLRSERLLGLPRMRCSASSESAETTGERVSPALRRRQISTETPICIATGVQMSTSSAVVSMLTTSAYGAPKALRSLVC